MIINIRVHLSKGYIFALINNQQDFSFNFSTKFELLTIVIILDKNKQLRVITFHEITLYLLLNIVVFPSIIVCKTKINMNKLYRLNEFRISISIINEILL